MDLRSFHTSDRHPEKLPSSNNIHQYIGRSVFKFTTPLKQSVLNHLPFYSIFYLQMTFHWNVKCKEQASCGSDLSPGDGELFLTKFAVCGIFVLKPYLPTLKNTTSIQHGPQIELQWEMRWSHFNTFWSPSSRRWPVPLRSLPFQKRFIGRHTKARLLNVNVQILCLEDNLLINLYIYCIQTVRDN